MSKPIDDLLSQVKSGICPFSQVAVHPDGPNEFPTFCCSLNVKPFRGSGIRKEYHFMSCTTFDYSNCSRVGYSRDLQRFLMRVERLSVTEEER